MAHLTEKQPSTMTGAILMVGRRRRSRQYQGEPQSRVQILRGGYVHAEHWVKVSAGESVSITIRLPLPGREERGPCLSTW